LRRDEPTRPGVVVTPPDSGASGDDAVRATPKLLAVFVVQALVLLALWAAGRYFSTI
jgi:hypothetical protein